MEVVFDGETGGETVSCGASAKLFMRGILLLVFAERSDSGLRLFKRSSIRLGFLALVAVPVGEALRLDETACNEPAIVALPAVFNLACSSISVAASVLFSGEAVLGLAAVSIFSGDPELDRDPSLPSLGFGSGGKLRAEVPGLDECLSLLERWNGNSRRGGISCSRVSGSAIDAAVDGRTNCGSPVAGSDESKARLITSVVAEE